MLATNQTRKRATNISLSANLLDEARELYVKVLQACEKPLVREIKAAREAKWLDENHAAIDSWNE
jgi:antitoxin CcdA